MIKARKGICVIAITAVTMIIAGTTFFCCLYDKIHLDEDRRDDGSGGENIRHYGDADRHEDDRCRNEHRSHGDTGRRLSHFPDEEDYFG